MFNFIKKLFTKKIDTSKFMFLTDEDVKQKIVIDKMYNKKMLIEFMQQVINENNIDVDIMQQDIKYIGYVFYKAMQDLEDNIKKQYAERLGVETWQIPEKEEDGLVKFFVYLETHFTKLFYEYFADNNFEDTNKDYVYTIFDLGEISRTKSLITDIDKLYFEEKWDEFLQIAQLKNTNNINNNIKLQQQ